MDDERLVEEVKKYSELYARNSPAHRNSSKRIEAWTAISKTINVPVKKCQTRWRSLRDRYLRILIKRKQLCDNEAEHLEWDLFNKLSFIEKYVRTKKTDDLESPCMGGSRFKHNKSCLDESILINSNMREQNVGIEERLMSFIDNMQNIVEQKYEDYNYGEHNDFLKLIAEKLKKLPDDDQEDTKMYFLNYLHNRIVQTRCDSFKEKS